MIVEAQYGWNGTLTAYHRDNSFIPLDPGNRDYQEIQQAIATGTCTLVEPILGEINPAKDRYGNHSGYHTRFGFVPSYQRTGLLELIEEQILTGDVRIVDPDSQSPVTPLPKLRKLVFSTILEQPWPHLNAEFQGELAYASHTLSARRPFKFTLKNLPEAADSKLNILLKQNGIESDLKAMIPALQFGVIEIEVPVAELRRLFNGELRLIPAWMAPFVEDLLQQHYAQTRRTKREGPDIAWLITHVDSYMRHFVIEFVNQVLYIAS